jgi:uncharacterized protein (TIGR03083 family)
VLLIPRYGTDPVIVLDGEPSAIAEPAIRQRRRLAALLADLDDDQWAHPSRCAGWSSRDVILHLDSTNNFWAFSIAQARRGEPTTFLATFDPVASPVQLVNDAGAISNAATLERFSASTEALVEALESLDGDGWATLAEAPPGHISVSALAHHALWDSWVHERDIVLPLGGNPVEESDEIAACLRYGAALSPAFSLNGGAVGRGTLTVDVTEPDLSFVVDVGDRVSVRAGNDTTADMRFTGNAVELLEALSFRRPLDQEVPEESAWMLRGLADVFDVADR